MVTLIVAARYGFIDEVNSQSCKCNDHNSTPENVGQVGNNYDCNEGHKEANGIGVKAVGINTGGE